MCIRDSLQIAPQLRPPIPRLDTQRPCQTAIDIQPTKVGLRLIDHLITMRIQATGQLAQGRRLAHPGFAGDQADALSLIHISSVRLQGANKDNFGRRRVGAVAFSGAAKALRQPQRLSLIHI